MTSMEKNYTPLDIEKRWYSLWESNNQFEPQGDGAPYCIMLPPPNVTGSLHMGHGFNNTIMDVLTRFKRMQGFQVLWQPGTDHAGIATQMVVERQLEAKGQKRQDMGREAFVDQVWQWKKESGGKITQQIRRLGSSVDWSRERFTMDEALSKAVNEAFVRLYEKGLIYRGKRLVNWDTQLATAISDLEVESRDTQGSLWHIRYPLLDQVTTSEGLSYLVVATTRPETLLGDVAIAVNPEDVRYQHLIGQFAELPILGRKIPIIADDYCDPEFGTGCVKITPAHDFNDYEVGKRQGLALINVLSADGKILAQAQAYDYRGQSITQDRLTLPKHIAGLSREAARKIILEELSETGALILTQPHQLKVPHGDRSGTVIEPWLTDQWYVSTQSMAKAATLVVENGQVQFTPRSYENMFFSWMRDIQDWCISRQLWWGHRIPAWYDSEGTAYVGRDENEVRHKYHLNAQVTLIQDDDVLDTWFSSGLWTFSTLGWPEQTDDLKKFHPTDVLVTGFDIIFFWVARMMMMSLELMGEIPFKRVYVHGLVRDAQGQKMSKSKGNVLDPIDIIDGIAFDELIHKRTQGMMQPKLAEKITKQTLQEYPKGIASYGTDALRFTFCSLASTGRDIQFDMGRVEGYRNFCNKLWNAAYFALENLNDLDLSKNHMVSLTINEDFVLESNLIDQWILSRLQQCIKDVTRHLDDFRFDMAAHSAYEFVWDEFCAWYLELIKPTLWNTSEKPERLSTQLTLLYVLEQILKLLHPMMPFITEELWHCLPSHSERTSIMKSDWPKYHAKFINPVAMESITWMRQVIVAVRQIRADMQISPGKTLKLILIQLTNAEKMALDQCQINLMKLAKIESIMIAGVPPKELCATALVGEMQLHVPLSGLVDAQAELTRLEREMQRLQGEVLRINNKLSNVQFVNKAPAHVLETERQKLHDVQKNLETLMVKHSQWQKL